MDSSKFNTIYKNQRPYFNAAAFESTAARLRKDEEKYVGKRMLLGGEYRKVVAVVCSECGLISMLVVEWQVGDKDHYVVGIPMFVRFEGDPPKEITPAQRKRFDAMKARRDAREARRVAAHSHTPQ